MRAKMKRRRGASQKRRCVVVVAHLQRRSSQRAALHADELHPLDALSGTDAGGWVFLRVQIVLHVAPIDDTDPLIVVPRFLAARSELAAHLGVRGCARGDRGRRDPDRPGGREHPDSLGTEGTAQIFHREDLLSARVARRYWRVHRARHGDVPRRRLRRATQILLTLQAVVRALHKALRPGQLGEIAAGHRVTVAAIDRVLVAAGSLVVVNVRADAVAGVYA